MREENRQKGFTLIEIIMVLLIVGIMAAFAGLGIVNAVQGYIFSKDNATNSEKAQLALSHIYRELLECYNCSSTAGSILTSTPTSTSFSYLNPLGTRTINWGSSTMVIQLDGSELFPPYAPYTETLIDTVSSFSLTYNADKSITVTMSLTGVPDSFSTNIFPRNTP